MASSGQVDKKLTDEITALAERLSADTSSSIAGKALVQEKSLPGSREDVKEACDGTEIYSDFVKTMREQGKTYPQIVFLQTEAALLAGLQKALLSARRTYPELLADGLARSRFLSGPSGPLYGQILTAMVRPLGASKES